MDSNVNSCDWAIAGCLVKCINDNFSNAPANVRIAFAFPVKGRLYTIRTVVGTSSGAPAFLLAEIVNPIVKWPPPFAKATCEPSFFHWRFERFLEKLHKPLSNEDLQQIRAPSQTAKMYPPKERLRGFDWAGEIHFGPKSQ
jgi:hypothetical protein